MEARMLRLEYRCEKIPDSQFAALHYYRKAAMFDRLLSFDIATEGFCNLEHARRLCSKPAKQRPACGVPGINISDGSQCLNAIGADVEIDGASSAITGTCLGHRYSRRNPPVISAQI